jgi:hypothetical protein
MSSITHHQSIPNSPRHHHQLITILYPTTSPKQNPQIPNLQELNQQRKKEKEDPATMSTPSTNQPHHRPHQTRAHGLIN